MHNEKGLTLLEVLLTITILTIVLTSILTLFPQISLFNKKTDETFSGINLAKEKIVILENLVRDDHNKSSTEKIFKISNNTLILTQTDKNFSRYKRLNLIENIEENNDAYILKTIDHHLHGTITIERTPEYEGIYHLYKVYVQINDEKLSKVTSLYGYLSVSE